MKIRKFRITCHTYGPYLLVVLVQTSLGETDVGFPGGWRWRASTRSQGHGVFDNEVTDGFTPNQHTKWVRNDSKEWATKIWLDTWFSPWYFGKMSYLTEMFQSWNSEQPVFVDWCISLRKPTGNPDSTGKSFCKSLFLTFMSFYVAWR